MELGLIPTTPISNKPYLKIYVNLWLKKNAWQGTLKLEIIE